MGPDAKETERVDNYGWWRSRNQLSKYIASNTILHIASVIHRENISAKQHENHHENHHERWEGQPRNDAEFHGSRVHIVR
jgi:hypothetical protein